MNSRGRKKQKDRQTTVKMLALISQFGISMLVPTFLCFFLGMYLDRFFGTSFLIVIFFFIGALAGFRNVYILAKRSMETPKDHENEK